MKTVDFLSAVRPIFRLIAADTARLAGQAMDHAEQANKIFPSDGQRKNCGKRAPGGLAALSALDVRLTHCYEILQPNPQGAFGETARAERAAQGAAGSGPHGPRAGKLIDQEETLLRNIMESDKKR